MELRAGAGGLGGDGVGVHREAVHALHLDAQVLAACREDLLVEQPVARIAGQGALAHVRLPSVGRMPTMIRCAPTAEARSSAWLSASRISCSQEPGPPDRSRRGGMLISRLKRPSSLAQAGSAIAWRTSVFRMTGRPSSPTRLSSISSPTCGRSLSKPDSRSICARTSRQVCILSRYRRRSSRVNTRAGTSRPIGPSRVPSADASPVPESHLGSAPDSRRTPPGRCATSCSQNVRPGP